MHWVFLEAGMGHRGLEEYLATLSENEKRQYKRLIDECRQRDSEIKKNCDELKKGFEALINTIKRNAEAVQAFQKALQGSRENIPAALFRDYPQSFN